MKPLNKRLLGGMAAIAAAAALMIPSAAFAQGGPGNGHGGGHGAGRGGGVGGGRGNGGGGHGGGNGGGQGEETAGNNLSVPTTFVLGGAANPFGLTCPSGPVDPTGTPLTNYEESGYYFVQGVHTWQAECLDATTASVTAKWGDNLAVGAAALKTGSPIRVEMSLINDASTTMTGYKVIKLDPSELDRVSPYGTLAAGSIETGFSATQQTFPYETTDPETGEAVTVGTRVYDIGATFSVHSDTANTYLVQPGTTMGAEINAGGAVVYGYNLRVDKAGTYTITFDAPTVTISGTNGDMFGEHTASITFEVTARGGGGGGGGGH